MRNRKDVAVAHKRTCTTSLLKASACGGYDLRHCQQLVEASPASPCDRSTRKNHEFIQSIRTDPVLAHRIGVLMSESKPNQRFAESCIALLHLDKREVDGESGR
ncbi:unnamed protein product [Polarella glacialis]|uniref:Uncharacterized protein n=1 Tax=Polarella glacialis TaxID=89957 RepID=A0A813ENB5_POLGL|nr:unnamed protein product [Polarella glacialis]